MIRRIGSKILKLEYRCGLALATQNKEQSLGEHDRQISKDRLLEIIADKYCRNIIRSTIDNPKSATELANTHEIPLNTVYRKLRLLVKNKIMRISGVITSDGKKIFLYQSRISDMTVYHICSSLEVEVLPNISLEGGNSPSSFSCPICRLLSENNQTI